MRFVYENGDENSIEYIDKGSGSELVRRGDLDAWNFLTFGREAYLHFIRKINIYSHIYKNDKFKAVLIPTGIRAVKFNPKDRKMSFQAVKAVRDWFREAGIACAPYLSVAKVRQMVPETVDTEDYFITEDEVRAVELLSKGGEKWDHFLLTLNKCFFTKDQKIDLVSKGQHLLVVDLANPQLVIENLKEIFKISGSRYTVSIGSRPRRKRTKKSSKKSKVLVQNESKTEVA